MASTWVQGYLQASFRGVEFFVSKAETTSGRRIASHQFPEKDNVQHEDLGQGETTFTFSAYILGDNYFQHREDLIAALNAKGPGKLVHPYRGTFQAVCRPFKQVETTAEGRLCRFDLTFDEDVVESLTTSVKNPPLETRKNKFSFIDALNAAFADLYDLASAPAGFIQDALNAVDKGLSVIESAKKVVSAYAEFQRQIANVRGKLIEVTLNGELLASSLSQIVEFGTDPEDTLAPATPVNGAEQFLEMANLVQAQKIPASNTPPEIYEDPTYPAQQIQTLISNLAIACAAGLVPVTPLNTVEEAQNLRTQLFDALDSVLEDPTTSDEVFAATRDAKVSASADLDQRILDLSSTVTVRLTQTTPSLKFVNDIFGNIDNEQEVLARNNVGHPGFMPANVDLKVDISV